MAPKPKIRSSDAQRLDESVWTTAALEQLATAGIESVRVEVLAKQLEVTKGSFYWHFKDRDALYETMLAYWRRRATLEIIERLDQAESSPHVRLRRLLRVPHAGRRPSTIAQAELGIRLWGRRDERAATALAEVDQLRLRYIENLLRQCGVPQEDIEARAILGYSYMQIAGSLVPKEADILIDRCIENLIGRSLNEPTDEAKKSIAG